MSKQKRYKKTQNHPVKKSSIDGNTRLKSVICDDHDDDDVLYWMLHYDECLQLIIIIIIIRFVKWLCCKSYQSYNQQSTESRYKMIKFQYLIGSSGFVGNTLIKLISNQNIFHRSDAAANGALSNIKNSLS